jgi:hypothetical protein
MSYISEISVQDIIAANRWDIGFRTGLKHMRERMAALQAVHSSDEAFELLENLPLENKLCLLPLLRNSRSDTPESIVSRACSRWPFLALALVENNAPSSIVRLREQIAIDDGHAQAFISLTDARTVITPIPIVNLPTMKVI